MVPILDHVRIIRRKRFEAEREELSEAFRPLRTSAQLARLSASRRSADEDFHFAVLGDAEPGRFWFSRALFNVPGVFERQVKAIQDHPIDFSVQLGDMVSRGLAENYRRLHDELSRLNPGKPYLTVIGNHDRHSPNLPSRSDFYRACFGKTNYAFDHGGVRFVALDSSRRAVSGRQLRWMDMALRTTRKKIVFTHIPPGVLSWTHFAGAKGVGGFRRGGKEFTEIAARHGVERVYMGHIHGFGVQDYHGVRYVLTGGGGSPLFPLAVEDRFHHFIVVRIHAGGVEDRVYSLDGHHFQIPSGKVVIQD